MKKDKAIVLCGLALAAAGLQVYRHRHGLLRAVRGVLRDGPERTAPCNGEASALELAGNCRAADRLLYELLQAWSLEQLHGCGLVGQAQSAVAERGDDGPPKVLCTRPRPSSAPAFIVTARAGGPVGAVIVCQGAQAPLARPAESLPAAPKPCSAAPTSAPVEEQSLPSAPEPCSAPAYEPAAPCDETCTVRASVGATASTCAAAHTDPGESFPGLECAGSYVGLPAPAKKAKRALGLGHTPVHVKAQRSVLDTLQCHGLRFMVLVLLLCSTLTFILGSGLTLAAAVAREFVRGAGVLLIVLGQLGAAAGAALRIEAAACHWSRQQHEPTGRVWRGIWALPRAFALQLALVAVALLAPMATVLWADPGTLAAFTAVALTVIVSLKLYSFAHSCESLRAEARRKAAAGVAVRAGTRAPTAPSFAWYLLVPTLCYQPKYPCVPRSAARALGLAAQLALFALTGLALVTSKIYPSLVATVAAWRAADYACALRAYLVLVGWNLAGWLLMAFGLFEVHLGLVAELTGFGDRVFYDAWWGSGSVGTFWVRWNKPVTHWMRRHVYEPARRAGLGSQAAALVVFAVSAALHELAVAVPLRRVTYPYAAAGMLLQVPLAALCRLLHTEKMAEQIPALPEVVETRGVPVLLYTPRSEIEPDALRQLVTVAESPLPAGDSYVAAMPDVHLGRGVTIGTVFASEKFVCPNAVGVDIGCGMCAVPLKDLHKDDLSLEQLQTLQKLIKKRIPTGFNEHKKALPEAAQTLADISARSPPSSRLAAEAAAPKAARQLGTLGGGNHFLELLYDEEATVWIMLHSGSRNIGNQTAQYHDKVARTWLKERGVEVPGGLNYLEIDSQAGKEYLQDMAWCQEYAMQNRLFMRRLMEGAVAEVTGAQPDHSRAVNIHHNFCQCERCSYTDPRTGEAVERELWVTRKGATPAMEGQLGLIPGSMGTGSFVVRGRGNPKSWNSCSHGAGRKMSRTRAKAEIKPEDFRLAMEGIVCDTDKRVIDEAPAAYKDLTQVMAYQADLVDVVHRLHPLLNVKGF
ncbi:hypothetical protein WJX81_001622 [Elliptochloris bilobata]|uniref:3'-phosphate/5'-hydroxy nucleic acid ligase n=1 Tax=Elliptochloris bilobata TaxID=381761 RepID=A0AAW1SGB9_9CHLO